MTQPGLLVRIVGSPIGALLLLAGSGIYLFGWWMGHVSWLAALIAAGTVIRTLTALRHMRIYKAWLAERQAMRAEVEGEPVKHARKRGGLLVVIALILFAVIPAGFAQARMTDPALEGILFLLWCALGLFLLWKLLRLLFRLVKKAAKPASLHLNGLEAKPIRVAEAAPVSCLLRKPSSSPSRSDIERELPDYCRQLLASSAQA